VLGCRQTTATDTTVIIHAAITTTIITTDANKDIGHATTAATAAVSTVIFLFNIRRLFRVKL
jgi:hypothetical protein